MDEQSKSAADLFNIDFGDLDFDIGDFDMSDGMPDTKTRICQPRIDKEILTATLHYDHAKEFSRKIDLSGKTRTYAFISGAFIFGDIVEALWETRHVDIKNLYISTLSLSDENIDSWSGLLDYGGIEKLEMVISAYFYSHERNGLVPYLYEKLDQGDKTQIAFGAYHSKIIAMETHHGNNIVIHGSANTRSSFNMEQIMVEVNNRELFEFNRDMIHTVCEKYGTINHAALGKYGPAMSRTESAKLFKRMKGGDPI